MPQRSDARRRTSSSNQKFWRAHVVACQKSGLSRAEYCRQHNISHHQLRYWHKKQEQPGQTSPVQPGITFAPIALTRTVKNTCHVGWVSTLRVEVGNRFKVEVADEFSPVILARLISVLEGC